MTFETWLISLGKSQKTAKDYAGAITGSLSLWASESGLVRQSLLEITTTDDFISVAASIRKLAIYDARNTRGRGAYSAALNTYADYLAATTHSATEGDISQIVKDVALTDTVKESLLNARMGEGDFRAALIARWGGCAVTGYTDTRFLVATPIKPWTKADNQERLDPFNGFLLLPNLNKVFTLGFISFQASGAIQISAELQDLQTWGIHDGLQVRLSKEHQGYLDYHRQVVFRR